MEEFEFEKAVVELIEIEGRTTPAGAFHQLTFRVKPKSFELDFNCVCTVERDTAPNFEEHARRAYEMWLRK